MSTSNIVPFRYPHTDLFMDIRGELLYTFAIGPDNKVKGFSFAVEESTLEVEPSLTDDLVIESIQVDANDDPLIQIKAKGLSISGKNPVIVKMTKVLDPEAVSYWIAKGLRLTSE